MQVRMRSLMENKYARPEYERRLLLRETTAGLDEANSARIVDHYIRRTRMRLRRMEWPTQGIVEYKFGLKSPDPSLPSGCVALTNLYLTTFFKAAPQPRMTRLPESCPPRTWLDLDGTITAPEKCAPQEP